MEDNKNSSTANTVEVEASAIHGKEASSNQAQAAQTKADKPETVKLQPINQAAKAQAKKADPKIKFMVGLTTVILAAFFFCLGFIVCTLPMTTELLSDGTSNSEASPYGQFQREDLALETRNFTLDYSGTNEEKMAEGRETFAQYVVDAAVSASDNPETSDRWSTSAKEVLDSREGKSATEVMYQLAAIDPSYGFDQDALVHLEEVHGVTSRTVPVIADFGLLSVFCLVILGRLSNKRSLGKALIYSGCICIAVFLIIGAWALIDFNGLFAVMHSLFFAEGSWIFPADSLLITLYPITFWSGMALVWFTSSCVISAASIVIGALLARRK